MITVQIKVLQELMMIIISSLEDVLIWEYPPSPLPPPPPPTLSPLPGETGFQGFKYSDACRDSSPAAILRWCVLKDRASNLRKSFECFEFSR